MGYREARELARIRQELRELLMAERWEDADDVLARFRIAADGDATLRSELERWRLRFELLQMSSLSRAA